MTEKQIKVRNSLLAKIHTSDMYKEIMSYAAWEEFLECRFGVSSSSKLNIKELLMLVDILNGKDETLNLEPDIKGRNALKNTNATKKQQNTILYLAQMLGWSEKKLLMFVLKQTKEIFLSSENFHNLSKKNATKVINGLDKIIKYRNSKAR
ncbi:MAG: phage protein GemA/Gp16 family protein [Campylobacter sputorum]|uniref:phage protein GemA/Gp16 family protein n=1 Tax=Campylobacter sputorum TaxID=206 RepID=UPI002A91ADBE|nr:phage protein GemA/Gp16 family protein [Campylobacter sputorum]MDY6119997.1 phage protein GemA/Gp16 family protein [Campylobacter sputorum]